MVRRSVALLLVALCILAVSATVVNAAGIPIEPGMSTMSQKHLSTR